MHHRIHTTGLAKRALIGATIATALSATPAIADVGPQGVRAGHNVTVFHNIDMVAAFGSAVGSQTQIDVFRGTHRVGTARGTAVDTPEGGALETNHGPEGAAQPGDCWDGATPNVQPGDRIVVSNPGGQAGVDEAIVDNISIDSVTGLDTNPANGNPVELVTVGVDENATAGDDLDDDGIDGADPTNVTRFEEVGTDTVVADPRREVWVEGVARYVDAEGNETPIPLDALDSGEFLGPTDNQLRMSPTTVVQGAGGAGTYTAKYIEGQLNIERNRNNIPVATILQQLEEDGHGMGFGHTEILPPVSMLVEGMTEQAGPAPGCEAAPKYDSSLGTLSTSQLNIASTGPSATDPVLTVGGFAGTAVGSAAVVLTNGATSVEKGVTLDGNAGQQGWTAEFTRAELADLAQGAVTAQLSVDDTPVGATKTLQYDTVAPTFAVNLAEGTYTGTQRLIVTGDPVTYSVDGLPAVPYQGVPIELLPGTRTVVLTATDAAGNTTRRTLTYVINPAPSQQQQQPPPQGGGGGGGAAAASQSVAPAPLPLPLIANTTAAPRPAATMLPGARRVKRSAARRAGLLARFSVPRGASRATIRVYRSKAGVLRLVGTKRTSVRRGTNRVRLNGKVMRGRLTPGLYLIRVTLSTSTGRSGAAASQFVRVVR